ncbi:hypothetical protein D3C86_1172720 [compost metagenome]
MQLRKHCFFRHRDDCVPFHVLGKHDGQGDGEGLRSVLCGNLPLRTGICNQLIPASGLRTAIRKAFSHDRRIRMADDLAAAADETDETRSHGPHGRKRLACFIKRQVEASNAQRFAIDHNRLGDRGDQNLLAVDCIRIGFDDDRFLQGKGQLIIIARACGGIVGQSGIAYFAAAAYPIGYVPAGRVMAFPVGEIRVLTVKRIGLPSGPEAKDIGVIGQHLVNDLIGLAPVGIT